MQALCFAARAAHCDAGPLTAATKQGAGQVKDNGFDARFIFIREAEQAAAARLREKGLTDEQVEKAVQLAAEAAEEARRSGFYESVVDGDLASLEAAIFGPGGSDSAAAAAAAAAAGDGDVAMANGDAS